MLIFNDGDLPKLQPTMNHPNTAYFNLFIPIPQTLMRLNCLLAIFALLACTVSAIRQQDFVVGPPGMKDTVVYSGYLDTFLNDRKLHYVFVKADTNPDTAPLTIWLNGGPGCSSMFGYMQQIGPYIVGNTYKFGQDLVKNNYRWNKASNLLFIESPGAVGFSTDTNPDINYNDKQTADDCFAAIKDFIFNVAPQFANRALYISGQSYAGKYIPDLAVRAIDNNRQPDGKYINLKGVLIGNPIMNHADNCLHKNRIQFMIDHDFISERLLKVYRSACQIDFFSPRCEYFKYEFDLLRDNLNYYSVYEVCESGSTEDRRTLEFIKNVQTKLKQIHHLKKYGANPSKNYSNTFKLSLSQIPKCDINDGMIDYMNMYKAAYHVDKVNKTWSTCTDINYDITVQASMEEFRQIFLNKGIKVWLFSGDWDDVVPYPDTVYNLNLLGRKKLGNQEPWFVGETHSGFYQLYDSLTLISVKGSGHWVPYFKREAAYQMFYNFINDKPINTPVHQETKQSFQQKANAYYRNDIIM